MYIYIYIYIYIQTYELSMINMIYGLYQSNHQSYCINKGRFRVGSLNQVRQTKQMLLLLVLLLLLLLLLIIIITKQIVMILLLLLVINLQLYDSSNAVVTTPVIKV